MALMAYLILTWQGFLSNSMVSTSHSSLSELILVSKRKKGSKYVDSINDQFEKLIASLEHWHQLEATIAV
jgi:predicted transcriptional regulator